METKRSTLRTFRANDNVRLAYRIRGNEDAPPLILIHGFTGSSAVWQRNIEILSQSYFVIAPDLRGHGDSEKPRAGYHVARLAADLRDLIEHLELKGREEKGVRVVAGSLGCAVLWSFAELFGTKLFSHQIWVDQSPLQNYTSDGDWGIAHGNISINSAASLAHMQATLRYSPDEVYRGTVASCLAYRSHPDPSDANLNDEFTALSDEEFFVSIARKGNPEWFGKLMGDHTNLDWRDAIRQNFGPGSGCEVKVMVVASERSGCFPAAGPLFAARLIKEEDENEDEDGADGKQGMRKVARKAHVVAETIDWGGHWCYWENPERFNALVSRFLRDERV